MANKKYNPIQRWMRSQSGQTFLNYAYSWGAAVVIAGALFKLTHLDGADIMLFLGMGTEVIVFILAGFEPQEGLDDTSSNNAVAASGAPISEETAAALANAAENMSNVPAGVSGNVPGGGVVIIGNGTAGNMSSAGMSVPTEPQPVAAANDVPLEPVASSEESGAVSAATLAASMQSMPVFNPAQFQGMTPEMQEATEAYVEQLNALTETLKQVAEQSARLTRDSEEMETMNRTLTGINRFYEMQLRSVGTQSATIDEVNAQTKQLAAQLQELNEVYAKMVEALKMKIS